MPYNQPNPHTLCPFGCCPLYSPRIDLDDDELDDIAMTEEASKARTFLVHFVDDILEVFVLSLLVIKPVVRTLLVV